MAYRSRRKWILIYAVIAVVAYAVVYLLFFAHSPTTPAGSGSGGGFGYP